MGGFMGSTAGTPYFSVPELLGPAAPALREHLVLSTRSSLCEGQCYMSLTTPAALIQPGFCRADLALHLSVGARLYRVQRQISCSHILCLHYEVMRKTHVLALNLVVAAARALNLVMAAARAPGLSSAQSFCQGAPCVCAEPVPEAQLLQASPAVLAVLCSACPHSSSSELLTHQTFNPSQVIYKTPVWCHT